MIEVYFLGTAGTVPTKNRNLISVCIKRKSHIFLFDVGENTQKQMLISKISVVKLHSIFITHLHGDHLMGLPGILMSANLMNREKELLIYGPPGIRKFVNSIQDSIILNLNYDVKVIEIENEGIILETDEYTIYAGLAEHNCFCLFYVLQEKPRPGKFNRQKAIELGIPMGPLWKKLQNGEDIIL